MGRGALGVAQRTVPLRRGNAELRVRGGRQIADAAVWPNGVVVVLPNRQSLPGVIERAEQGLVQ
jgi:hypothetical protein